MSNTFSSGKHSIAECDRCGFRYKLKELRSITVKTKNTNILVCPTCWEPDQPQLQIGMYPVDDPQAVRNPRPDISYWQSGLTGIRTRPDLANGSSVLAFGTPAEGSRVIQWGWNPVGFKNYIGLSGLPNTRLSGLESALVGAGQIGVVVVVT